MVVVKKRVAGRIVVNSGTLYPAANATAPRNKSAPGHVQRVKACRECSWRYHLAVYFNKCPNCKASLRSMEWTEDN